MPKRKVLQHRVLTIWFNDRHSLLAPAVRIQREDKDRSYVPTPHSVFRLQKLINQPGMTCDIDLFSCLIDYYFLRNIEVEELVVPEPHDEKVEVNGQSHTIPY